MKKFWKNVWGGIERWGAVSFALALPTFVCFLAWVLTEPETFWQKAFILVPCLVLQLIFAVAGVFLIHVGRQF